MPISKRYSCAYCKRWIGPEVNDEGFCPGCEPVVAREASSGIRALERYLGVVSESPSDD
jgi:hypothetical protein